MEDRNVLVNRMVQASLRIFPPADDDSQTVHPVKVLVNAIDFITYCGLDRVKFLNNIEVENKLALDAITKPDLLKNSKEFVNYLRENKHSAVELFDHIYDSHPEIAKTISKNAFAEKMLLPIYLDYRTSTRIAAKNARKKHGTAAWKIVDWMKSNYTDKYRSESLKLFDFFAEHHAEDAKKIHEIGTKLPPMLLPRTFLRVFDQVERGQDASSGTTSWSPANRSFYTTLLESAGLPYNMEVEIGEKKEEKKKGSQN
jgi:hypothetical protein